MDKKKRILIIEDDPDISRLLQVMLAADDREIVAAYSGTEGLLRLQGQGASFDLVLLDLMLPGMSGEELIREIRRDSTVPILVISAKAGVADKVAVLQMGADDYMTKPFHQEEVAARVEVQLRKSAVAQAPSVQLEWRDLALHLDKLAVTLHGQALSLTKAELDILTLLLRHPERAFSKKEIYESLWTGPYYGDDNTISVHMSNIRKKIAAVTAEEYIKTIWGIGFMLV
ncbi:DNA-binding response regulator [Sporosarcina sp. NCCP-2716]|uniref:response regulator transcription factor n=1 Tax=Sporosarcina sp. NCCP-2716 TaxID=2943679 RepID=UPI00203E1F6F|nr:response regulator transcription factor [Sporosarcina sp. NCCP-2716]GKV69755.1 DNA-binding response regulator [Sporosarcina sp. NCCP-2716]